MATKFILTIPLLLVTITALSWGNTLYIHVKAVLAQFLIADAWADTLERDRDFKPWPWADTWPVARMHTEILDGDLYILAGAHGSTLAFGPGHMDGTVAPGESGSSVIAGHRDTHFEFLENIVIDDRFQIQTRRGTWQTYLVSNIDIIDTTENDTWLLDQSLDTIYLVTCFPFDAINPGGPLRIVVQLEPVSRVIGP
ncbi:MAG TPA: class GN sortase [Pseudomonadales bacterium]|nr:class GN sortase [Pseudomonadales bacterium]MDP6314652.1 class GN sortase [Pseudomonadales bacterium]MDP7313367.1 class GN sortase [Pseudomonadales bacterium]HJP51771.1 class GN sortase [Pseudomonadales bacterium]